MSQGHISVCFTHKSNFYDCNALGYWPILRFFFRLAAYFALRYDESFEQLFVKIGQVECQMVFSALPVSKTEFASWLCRCYLLVRRIIASIINHFVFERLRVPFPNGVASSDISAFSSVTLVLSYASFISSMFSIC